LTNRATEALCWALLSFAQIHAGQLHNSICSGRRALALSQEIKNVWAQVNSTQSLTQGLLDAGVYEEALALMQDGMALARTLPPTLNFMSFLAVLGRTYHAVQWWEEARSTLEEAEAVAKTLDLGLHHVPVFSQLCMHYVQAGEWEAAYRYAVKAIALRKSRDEALIPWDFYSHYETEALLRGGDESQARAAVQQLGERLGNYQRYRLPYLRARARLSAWEGQSEQAINHLREAAGLAVDLGLPAEQWQIQADLASVYEAGGEPVQAHTAWAKASTIIQGLAQDIKDEALRSRFLAGAQIRPVMQQALRNVNQVPKDHA